jgi:diacylglycerol kinase family enzyme
MDSSNAPDGTQRPAPAARPALRRVSAVVNAASGGVGAGAAEQLAALVAEHGYDLTLWTPAPDEVTDAVRSAVDDAPDLLIVLAGDGTARLVAETCGPDGPLVAPLPGGTLNMLPHALYGALPWPRALRAALESGVERPVSGGRVAGRAFYVAGILGAPALWAYAREAARKGDFPETWRRAAHALRRAFTGDVHFVLDGRGGQRQAEALVLINPLVSKAMLDTAALEVAALEAHSAREIFRLAVNGLFSDWRHDPAIFVGAAARGRVWARHSIPCILDGEVHHLPRKVTFAFDQRAFRALAPPQTALASL